MQKLRGFGYVFKFCYGEKCSQVMYVHKYIILTLIPKRNKKIPRNEGIPAPVHNWSTIFVKNTN